MRCAPSVGKKKTQGTKRRHQPTLNCYTVLPLMALTCINSFPGFTQLPTPFLRQLWVKQLWGTEYDEVQRYKSIFTGHFLYVHLFMALVALPMALELGTVDV